MAGKLVNPASERYFRPAASETLQIRFPEIFPENKTFPPNFIFLYINSARLFSCSPTEVMISLFLISHKPGPILAQALKSYERKGQ